MKCRIFISGQTGGNLLLARKMKRYDRKGTMFNSIVLYYNTLKEARKDIWEAYKELRMEDLDDFGLSYYPKHSVSYDASIAKIHEGHE